MFIIFTFRVSWFALAIFISSSLLLPPTLFSAAPVPDVSLEVTVRQKTEGKMEKGLHVMELNCFGGSCSLMTLSINQCGEGSRGPAFYPKVEWRSTAERGLSVTELGGVLEVQYVGVDIGGNYVTTLRFGYAKSRFDSILATKVTSFSGGYVKHSQILKRVITAEYVPLVGKFNYVKLDCPALLPGVEKNP